MSTGFTCSCDQLSGSRAVVTVAGELDVHNCGEFQKAIAAAARCGPDHLLFDLSDVSFMDSTALGVLAAEQRRRRNRCTSSPVSPSCCASSRSRATTRCS